MATRSIIAEHEGWRCKSVARLFFIRHGNAGNNAHTPTRGTSLRDSEFFYRYERWRLLCEREHVETLDDGGHRDSSHHEQCVGLRQEDPRHRENASRKSARMNWRSQEFGVVINRSGRGAEVPHGEQKP